MSVYSMTGYACLHLSYPDTNNEEKTTHFTDTQPGWRLTLELRSVNSRFLDLSFKLGCTRCHLRTLGRSHRLRDFADLVHNFGRFAAEHGHIRDKTGYSHGSYGERCTNGVCCNERS